MSWESETDACMLLILCVELMRTCIQHRGLCSVLCGGLDGKEIHRRGDLPGSSRTPQPLQETPETQVQSLGREDPLEEEMATHSSILAWRSPWTEEHTDRGGLQPMVLQRFSTHI